MGVLDNKWLNKPVTDDLSKLDERSLVARAKTDNDAFGELYSRYIDRIYNYILYRTGNREDAEDLAARTFQRALKHIPRYEDKGLPFSAWLYRIARNLVANHHRDNGRRQMVSLDEVMNLQEGDGSPERVVQMVENEETLLNAIRRLPSDRQELLLLKFLDRMPNTEIGDVLGRSEGAIKSLYHRTLQSLRDELGIDIEAEEEKRKQRRFRLPWNRREDDEQSGDGSVKATDPEQAESPAEDTK